MAKGYSTDLRDRAGHCRSPLKPYEHWLLDLVAAEPDLTLDEIGTGLASAKN